MNKCVILSTQRSGSTLVADYLSSGQDFLIHSELFQMLNPKAAGTPTEPHHYPVSYERYSQSSVVRRIQNRVARRLLVERYLSGVYAPQEQISLIGMKFMYGQARRYPEVMDWLVDNNVKFVHLVRKNALEVIVSRELAAKRGTHSMLKELPAVKLRLDPDELKAEIKVCVDEINHYRGVCESLNSYEMSYEDFAVDMEKEARAVLSFLGIETTQPLTSILRKTNPRPLRDTIENYDQISRCFSGTQFEQYLD